MVYMYHSFLVHSSADGHLGCFHVRAVINSAAMNIGVHVSLSDLVSLVCIPRSGIAGSYGSSISSFEEISTLFSIAAVLVCIPTNSVRGFPFLLCDFFLKTSANTLKLYFLPTYRSSWVVEVMK